MRHLFLSTLLALASLTAHAAAQSNVCIGGDLGRLTATEKAHCLDSAARVRAAANRFNAPAGWHFVIVCTEYDWQTYAAFSDRPAPELAALTADTSLTRRTTFFRGQPLTQHDPVRLQLAVAHEVASALLGSKDELAIEDRVSLWLSASERTVTPQHASR